MELEAATAASGGAAADFGQYRPLDAHGDGIPVAGAAAGAGFNDVVIAAVGHEDENVVVMIRALFRDAKGEEVVLNVGAHLGVCGWVFDVITDGAETDSFGFSKF